MNVTACAVPHPSLLNKYVEQPGAYSDCFEVVHNGQVDLAQLITAFYTTWLFRLERLVLTLPLRHWVRDAEVQALAKGHSTFAVWREEARKETEVLLCDLSGRTRSYLAIHPKEAGQTHLLFGSAVVPQEGGALSPWVQRFLPVHRLYSLHLLRTAEKKLRR